MDRSRVNEPISKAIGIRTAGHHADLAVMATAMALQIRSRSDHGSKTQSPASIASSVAMMKVPQ